MYNAVLSVLYSKFDKSGLRFKKEENEVPHWGQRCRHRKTDQYMAGGQKQGMIPMYDSSVIKNWKSTKILRFEFKIRIFCPPIPNTAAPRPDARKRYRYKKVYQEACLPIDMKLLIYMAVRLYSMNSSSCYCCCDVWLSHLELWASRIRLIVPMFSVRCN